MDNKLQIDDNTKVEMGQGASLGDIEEMMDFRGQYGNSDSLALKG